MGGARLDAGAYCGTCAADIMAEALGGAEKEAPSA